MSNRVLTRSPLFLTLLSPAPVSYQNIASKAGEISLQQGQVVWILDSTTSDEWWFARLDDGSADGWVPRAWVMPT